MSRLEYTSPMTPDEKAALDDIIAEINDNSPSSQSLSQKLNEFETDSILDSVESDPELDAVLTEFNNEVDIRNARMASLKALTLNYFDSDNTIPGSYRIKDVVYADLEEMGIDARLFEDIRNGINSLKVLPADHNLRSNIIKGYGDLVYSVEETLMRIEMGKETFVKYVFPDTTPVEKRHELERKGKQLIQARNKLKTDVSGIKVVEFVAESILTARKNATPVDQELSGHGYDTGITIGVIDYTNYFNALAAYKNISLSAGNITSNPTS